MSITLPPALQARWDQLVAPGLKHGKLEGQYSLLMALAQDGGHLIHLMLQHLGENQTLLRQDFGLFKAVWQQVLCDSQGRARHQEEIRSEEAVDWLLWHGRKDESQRQRTLTWYYGKSLTEAPERKELNLNQSMPGLVGEDVYVVHSCAHAAQFLSHSMVVELHGLRFRCCLIAADQEGSLRFGVGLQVPIRLLTRLSTQRLLETPVLDHAAYLHRRHRDLGQPKEVADFRFWLKDSEVLMDMVTSQGRRGKNVLSAGDGLMNMLTTELRRLLQLDASTDLRLGYIIPWDYDNEGRFEGKSLKGSGQQWGVTFTDTDLTRRLN